MEKFKGKINNRKDYSFLIFYIGIVVITHLCIKEYMGDALNLFNKILEQYSLKEALIMRYNTWTSRIIIEIPLYLISHNMHFYIWMIIDIVMFIILLLSLMKLTQNKHNKLLIFLILLYPISDMRSAGWIATTINYLWPTALGCASFVLLHKMYHNEKINIWFIPLYMLCELFSTNFETFSVYYFVILGYFTVNMIIERKFTVKYAILTVIQFIISIWNIYLTLTCPGNWVRGSEEITKWMIDFPSYTFVDKISLGVVDTTSKLIQSNLLFFILVLLIFIITIKKRESIIVTALSAIPVVSISLITFLAPLSKSYFALYEQLFITTRIVNPMTYTSFIPYLAFVFFMLIITVCVVMILNLAKDLKSGILLMFILSVGFATRAILGFSPTIFASSYRTFIFLDFSIIYCIVKLFDDNKELLITNENHEKYLTLIGLLIVIFHTINMIITISFRY